MCPSHLEQWMHLMTRRDVAIAASIACCLPGHVVAPAAFFRCTCISLVVLCPGVYVRARYLYAHVHARVC